MVMEMKKKLGDAKTSAEKKKILGNIDSDLTKKLTTFPKDSSQYGLMFNQDHIRGENSKDPIKIKTE
jgi:hypothetical protein